METDIDKIDEYFAHLSEAVRNQLKAYYDTLLQLNTKLSLVSKYSLPFSANQHFADSVLGLELIHKEIPFTDKPIYDFGSGNGFPGLVLGIIKPNVQVLLVERDLRRSDFLKQMISELQLGNVRVLTQSMESLPKNSVDVGVVRQLGSIANVTIQLTSIFKPGGHIFHFKGDNWTSEIASCPTQIFSKWNIQSVGGYQLPEDGTPKRIVSSVRLD
jgi:16S rRNA (guanine527-N7)-methyltransferase